MNPDEHAIAANRALWNAWTRAHRESAFYDVKGFLDGRDPLNRIETAELGDVAGKRFLHLQCHFGVDTLGWARRGARVTGVDFSPEAIATARRLAGEAGLEATFIESEVYALDEHGLGRFDIVHTSYGVISWLPDLDRWARIIASHLEPGGLFHLVENHPFAMMLDEEGVSIRWPYLATGPPLRFDSVASYAAPIEGGPLPEYNWPHGIGEVVTALIGAGLRIAWLREYPRTPYPFPAFLEQRPGGDYGWPGGREDIPLTFSIGAVHAARRSHLRPLPGRVSSPTLQDTQQGVPAMDPGAFSISLAVKDLAASRSFYEKLGFEVTGGSEPDRYLILVNGATVIGLFQGMFDRNILTFNPGWSGPFREMAEFEDVRQIAERLSAAGIEFTESNLPGSAGPGHIAFVDPDGNPILIDQHR